MKKFQWDNRYKLGIDIIDHQHEKLVGIIGELSDSIDLHLNPLATQVSENEDLRKILDELTDYADLHFKTEEKYFHQFHYERSKEHEAQHTGWRKKIAAFKRKLRKGNSAISLDLLAFLENWFVTHLLGYDREYVPCFHKHGL